MRVMLAQSLRSRGALRQVLLPLQQLLGLIGKGLELGTGLARNAQKVMAFLQQLLAHGQTHATRATGQNRQMLGHV